MTVPIPDYNGLAKLALDSTALTPQDLAEAAVVCQDTIAALRLLERTFTDALGKTAGKHTGNVGDGRQYEVRRATDRKEYQHEEWQREVRRKVAEGLPDLVLIDPGTGEEFERSLAFVVSEAVMAAQQVHGAGTPRSGELRKLGLYVADYCTTTPAGWRLQTVRLDPDQATTPATAQPVDSPAIPTQREAS